MALNIFDHFILNILLVLKLLIERNYERYTLLCGYVIFFFLLDSNQQLATNPPMNNSHTVDTLDDGFINGNIFFCHIYIFFKIVLIENLTINFFFNYLKYNQYSEFT